MKKMLYEAHTVRDRYTILTLFNELGLMKKIESELIKKYY